MAVAQLVELRVVVAAVAGSTPVSHPLDEHPGIVFRGGPTGRRAALAGGPDVWELILTLKNGKTRGEGAITATAELLNLTDSQVRTAVRYYGAFPDEIDRRIALSTEDADEAEAAWQQELLGKWGA